MTREEREALDALERVAMQDRPGPDALWEVVTGHRVGRLSLVEALGQALGVMADEEPEEPTEGVIAEFERLAREADRSADRASDAAGEAREAADEADELLATLHGRRKHPTRRAA